MAKKYLDLVGFTNFAGKVKDALSNKVDTVDGMGLSQNSYTDEEKAKVASTRTELEDARTGYDGTEYQSTGEAIREQMYVLSNNFKNYSKEYKETISSFLPGFISPTGAISESDTYQYTDLIDVRDFENRTLLFKFPLRFLVAYDANKNIVPEDGINDPALATYSYTVPAGIAYIQITLEAIREDITIRTENANNGGYEVTRQSLHRDLIDYFDNLDTIYDELKYSIDGFKNFKFEFNETINIFTAGFMSVKGLIYDTDSFLNYQYSDYIDVRGFTGKTLNSSAEMRVITAYDINKTVLPSSGVDANNYTTEYIIPENVAYIRVTVGVNYTAVTIKTPNANNGGYEVTYEALNKDLITIFDDIKDKFDEFDDIKDEFDDIKIGYNGIDYGTAANSVRGQINSVLDKFSNYEYCFSKTITDYVIGKYVTLNGLDFGNETYNYTNTYIDVSSVQGKNLKFKYSNPNATNYTRFVTAYGSDKQALPEKGAEYVRIYTVPDDVYFIRASFSASNGTLTVYEENSTRDGYLVTKGNLDDELLSTLNTIDTIIESDIVAKNRTAIKESEAIVTGEKVTLGSGWNVKTNKNLAFYAKFTEFGTLRIGHGYTDYGSSYIEIDDTYIKSYYHFTTPILVKDVQHGLTLSDFVNVNIRRDMSGAKITVYTSTGSITIDGIKWTGFNGEIFAQSVSGSYTDCKLSWTCDGLYSNLWVFGDSYLSLGDDARWPKHITDLGYDKWMACGYPGGNAQAELASFKNLIKLSKPDVAAWFLGMNNRDATDAINSSYLSCTEEFLSICKENSILPVLATIPTTPTVKNEFKTAWVKESGYRYVDFYKAVGADSSGNWYAGMLSSDNVHPDPLGAKALASRILLDLPEITYKG